MAEVSRREHFFREAVVAVGALAVAGAATYLTGLWAWIVSQAAYFGEPVEVTRWWHWILLGNLTLTALLVGLLVVRRLVRPEYDAYREDRFFGLVWRWGWARGRLTGLWCWCPRCDRMMAHCETPATMDRPRTTTFHCQACEVPHERLGHVDDTLNEVRREIDLKVRKGSWKEMSDSQKQKR